MLNLPINEYIEGRRLCHIYYSIFLYRISLYHLLLLLLLLVVGRWTRLSNAFGFRLGVFVQQRRRPLILPSLSLHSALNRFFRPPTTQDGRRSSRSARSLELQSLN